MWHIMISQTLLYHNQHSVIDIQDIQDMFPHLRNTFRLINNVTVYNDLQQAT